MTTKTCLQFLTLVAASFTASLSFASGFAIQEQSVTGLGRAFAGSAAVADDGSTIFFNPAGLTQLDHAEMDMAVHYILPTSDFKNEGSSVVDLGGPPFTGQALTAGSNSGNEGGKEAFVPNFYYVQPISDTTVVGLGINAPFGLVTDYSETWPGRYHAVRSEMITINVNPSVGHQVTEQLSVGFGLNLQYIEVQLTQMADLGALGGTPQAADGKIRVEGDDWSWGYNLGLTYQFTEATRLGMAYRSKISHTLEGDGKLWTGAGSELADENIKADIDLPESLSVALHHQLNAQWAVMADVSWTRWNRFQNLVINSTNDTFDVNKPEKWRNTIRYGLGVDYQYNPKWTFRAGVAHDETPVSNEHRTARIPDADRKWLSVGASYAASDNLTFDAGYSHLFVKDPNIDELNASGYVLSGKYDADIDLLGVQVRWAL